MKLIITILLSFVCLNAQAHHEHKKKVRTKRPYNIKPKDGGASFLVLPGHHLELKECPRGNKKCVLKYKGETFEVPRSDLKLIRTAQRRVTPGNTKIRRGSQTNRPVQRSREPQTRGSQTRRTSPANIRNQDLNFGATTCSCVHETCRITSNFGPRRRPNSRASSYHEGLDIGGGAGTPIVAAESGQIVFAGNKGGYGKTIDIKHTNTYTTRYGHMRAFRKTSGWVQKGEVIGFMGATGNVTGPHLHFEIIKDGEQINPANLVSTRRSDMSQQCSTVLAIGAESSGAATARSVE